MTFYGLNAQAQYLGNTGAFAYDRGVLDDGSGHIELYKNGNSLVYGDVISHVGFDEQGQHQVRLNINGRVICGVVEYGYTAATSGDRIVVYSPQINIKYNPAINPNNSAPLTDVQTSGSTGGISSPGCYSIYEWDGSTREICPEEF
jgi:hypothetical protein